jgi:hypothetical protein
MIAIALSTLFAFAAVTALVVIAVSISQHGSAALAARGAWLACPEMRTVTYRISEVKVQRAPAKVLTLPVKPTARFAPPPQRHAA